LRSSNSLRCGIVINIAVKHSIRSEHDLRKRQPNQLNELQRFLSELLAAAQNWKLQ